MNFLTKNSKFFYLIYGILIGLTIILGVIFASQYYDVRVTFTGSGETLKIINTTSDSLGYDNFYVFKYFAAGATNGLTSATGFAPDYDNYKMIVYDFQTNLSSLNNMIILFSVFGLIAFALLLVLSNHNRNIYYKSNLIGGILLPLIVVVLFVVLLVKNLSVMKQFDDNVVLFNIVAKLMGTNRIDYSDYNYSELSNFFDINNLTFILFTILFVIVIAYSLFMAVYAYLKYKGTSEMRAEVEKKAVANND